MQKQDRHFYKCSQLRPPITYKSKTITLQHTSTLTPKKVITIGIVFLDTPPAQQQQQQHHTHTHTHTHATWGMENRREIYKRACRNWWHHQEKRQVLMEGVSVSNSKQQLVPGTDHAMQKDLVQKGGKNYFSNKTPYTIFTIKEGSHM